MTFWLLCVLKRKKIINIHQQVLNAQNLHSMSMRSDQDIKKKQHQQQHWMMAKTQYIDIL